ncbi:MAG: TIGR01459 family HAD-type hydrolase [Hyphomicrobiales bacterium]
MTLSDVRDTRAVMLHREKSDLLRTASELANDYDAWLCDVWGVVHNGVAAYEDAVHALRTFRQQDGKVVLITNAPRPSSAVVPQLRNLNIPEDAYDAIVTSGEVTRIVLEERPDTKVYHFGPEKDFPLLEGLKTPLVELDDADVVLLTGPMEYEDETVETYAPILKDFKARNLPMYCANPDLVVQRGDKLMMCAGALAKAYEELGGEVVIAGKPHAPIYDVARRQADEAAGHDIPQERLLCIGDGLPTDVKGAHLQGLDVLFLTGGIYAAELGGHLNEAKAVELNDKLESEFPGLRLAGINDELRWA